MTEKFFKIHFTIKKKPEDGVRYKSVPIDYMILASSRKKAMELAKNNIQEFLTRHRAEIKSERCAEIKYNVLLIEPENK